MVLKTTLCYIFKHDKVLMLYRNKKENDYHEGKWNGLGGKFEMNETPEQCVMREVYEESGLIIKDMTLIAECFFPNFQGDLEDELMYLYRCDGFDGHIIDSDEGELHWIEVEKILELNVWESDKLFLPYVIEGKRFKGTFEFDGKKLDSYKIELVD